ncbi:SPOCS domain-containing protein [Clostridium sp. Ade.TY]|uniref:SPOCS domain-containing protein n=1 Tax=Clostridium sp. Ade.TY TaxID=1391647 RepID=UPI0004019FAA|nr:SPOCS domain-containing protein [Clostridium sp. Ade.TY]
MSIDLRYNTQAKGAITFIGNTIGLSQLANANLPGVVGSIGAFTSLNTNLQVGTFPPGTTLNIQENGSAANLVLPPGSTVLRAELLWGGNYAYTYQDTSTTPITDISDSIIGLLNNSILFTTPLANNISISPEIGQEKSFSFASGTLSGTRSFYERSTDVTQYVQAAGSGIYSVQRVPGLVEPITNYTSATNHAGWTLAVIYTNPTLPERGLYLWTGAEIVATSNPNVDINVSGFETLPGGSINARLLLSTQEGDADIQNDRVRFGPTIASLATNLLSGPNNFSNNFFGSQINNDIGTLNTTGTFGTRNQSLATNTNISGGRQGWDITNIDVAPYMLNSQTSAIIRLETSQDAYMVNMVGLYTDILNLDIFANKTVDKTLANIGDQLTYTIVIRNDSNVPITNVSFVDVIPNGTTFVQDSVTIDGIAQIGANPQTGVPLSNLIIGSSTTVTFKVNVTSIPNPNPIGNIGNVNFEYGGVGPGTKATNIATTTVNTAIIQAVKSVDKNFGQPNDELTYSTVLTNIGTTNAQNVVFTDSVPAGTTFVANSLTINGVQQVGVNPASGVNIGIIPPGGSVIVTFKAKIINSIPAINPIINNNTTTYEYIVDPTKPVVVAPPTVSNNTSTQVNSAIVSVVKSVDKAVSSFGGVLTYTSVIRNTGNVSATNVRFLDSIPSGTTFVANSVSINGVNQPGLDPTVPINVGTIAVGGSVTVLFNVTVNNSLPAVNPIPNISGAAYQYLVNPAESPVDGVAAISNEVTTQINDVVISAVKSADKQVVDALEDITYTVVVSNNGNIVATGVQFVDTTPVGTTFVLNSVSINGINQPGANPNTGFTLPNISVGGSVTITFKVNVNNVLPLPNTINNFALITPPGKTPVNSNTVSTTVKSAKLQVNKQVNKEFADFSEVITYTVTITNFGTTLAEQVIFTDDIPIGTTFVANSVKVNNVSIPGANPASGVSLNNIPIGTAVIVSFDVTVNNGFPTPNPIVNTSDVDYKYEVNAGDPLITAPTATSNEVSTRVNRAILNQTKSVDTEFVDWGGAIEYTVVINNSGNVSANNLNFVDTIPPGTTFVPNSVKINGTTQIGANPGVGVPIASIAAGGSVTVTFIVTVNNANPTINPILNQSTTTYSYLVNPTGLPVNAVPSQSNVVDTTVNHAQITLTKSSSDNVVLLGDTFTYTITLENIGNATASAVELTDIVPDGTTFVTDSVTIDGVVQLGENPNNGINIGTIAAGGSVIVTFDVDVDATLPTINPMINFAESDYEYLVNPANPAVTAPTQTSNEIEVLVLDAGNFADLNVVKNVDKAFVELGDSLLYTFTITNKNTSTTDALNVVLTDVVPNGTTFVLGTVEIDGTPYVDENPNVGINIPGSIAINGSVEVTFEVIVDNELPTPNPIINTGDVTYKFRTNPGLDPIDGPKATSNQVSTLAKEVNVDARKNVSDNFADFGTELTYSIGVANLGTAESVNIVVTDSAPSGTTFVTGSVTVGGVSQPAEDPASGINIASISAGQIVLVTFRVTVNNGFPNPNPILNRGNIEYEYIIDPVDPAITGEAFETNEVSTRVNRAIVTVVKEVDKAFADLGEELTYTLTLTNSGNVSATDVLLLDDIPQGTTFVDDSVVINGVQSPGVSPVTGVPVALIIAGSDAVISFKVKVITTELPIPNPIVNQSIAEYEYRVNPNAAPVNAVAEPSDPVETQVNSAIVTATKTVDKNFVDLGEELTYTITVVNDGNVDTISTIVTDVVAEGLIFVEDSVEVDGIPRPNVDPKDGIDIGVLSNTTVEITFKVVVNDNNIPVPNPTVNIAVVDYEYLVDPNGDPVKGSTESGEVEVKVNHGEISSSKLVDRQFVGINGNITYTALLTNTGNVDVNNVLFVDVPPNGTVFVANSVIVSGVPRPGENPVLGINIGTIIPGNTVPITFTVRVNGAVPSPNPIVNISNTSYNYVVDEGNPPVIVENLPSNGAITTVNDAAIISTKDVDKEFADFGETLTYTITLRNTGNVSANNIVFTDVIPEGTNFVPNSVIVNGVLIPGVSPGNGINIGSLGTTTPTVITFKVVVLDRFPVPNPINNTAITTFDFLVNPNGVPVNGIPSATNNVETQVNNAFVNIQKSVDNMYKDLGDIATYSFVLKNTGNVEATGVYFVDVLEIYHTFVLNSVYINGSLVPGLNPNSGFLIGNIAPGAEVIIDFDVEIVSIPPSNQINNFASSTYTYLVDPQGEAVDGSSRSNITDIHVRHGEISNSDIVKLADRAVTTENDIITYTIEVTNSGNVPVNDVVVNDVLPVGVNFIQGSLIVGGVSKPSINLNDGIEIGTINAGATVVIIFKVRVREDAPSQIVNTATVDYSYIVDPEEPTREDSSISDEVKVNNIKAGLSLVKDSNVHFATVGDDIVYSIVATNTGEIDLISVIVKDLLEPNLDFVEDSVKVNGIAELTSSILLGVNVGPLAIGASKTITFKAKVISKGESDIILNKSTGVFTYKLTPEDQTRIKDTESNENEIIVKANELQVTKIADKIEASLNDIINYRVTILNTGDLKLFNVIFKDELPSNLKLVEESFKLNNTLINDVDLKAGVNIGTLEIGQGATIEYSVKVISGTCSGISENKAYAIYDYILDDGREGSGISNIAFVDIDINISTFKQISLNKEFEIPSEKPNIEELDFVVADVVIEDSYTVKTMISSSNEGQILSGYKLIIHGYVNISVEYTALLETQPVHSAHFKMPFSTFLILPIDYSQGTQVEVKAVVESLERDMIDNRSIITNIMLLLVGTVK